MENYCPQTVYQMNQRIVLILSTLGNCIQNGYMKKTITSHEYQDLVNWLKQARIDQGLSMRDLAEKINKPHSFVQRIEMLERRLDVHEYCLYCKALHINSKEGLDFFKCTSSDLI